VRFFLSFVLMLFAAMALTDCMADILQRVQRHTDVPASIAPAAARR